MSARKKSANAQSRSSSPARKPRSAGANQNNQSRDQSGSREKSRSRDQPRRGEGRQEGARKKIKVHLPASGKPAAGKKGARPAASKTIDTQKSKKNRWGESHEGFVPEEFRDSERGERLQKAMANLGVASRRHSEALIREGHVKVNGKLVDGLPAWVDLTKDSIQLDGVELNFAGKVKLDENLKSKQSHKQVYVLFHKPKGVFSTTDDPEGRRTVVDFVDLPSHFPQRLYPVGRLDADSTGLMLLTNDGDVAHMLTHPSFEISKEYKVMVKGRVTEKDLDRLREGLFLARRTGSDAKDEYEGDELGARRAAFSDVRMGGYQRDQQRGDKTVLYITLKEGQNREIRRLLAKLDFNVKKLQRIKIGPLTVKGLGVGSWRLLDAKEVKTLKRYLKRRRDREKD